MSATHGRRPDTVSDQDRHVTLNNGVQMPILGFGVFQVPPDQTEQAATDALSLLASWATPTHQPAASDQHAPGQRRG